MDDRSGAFPAVGALGTREIHDSQTRYENFCTATLVAPSRILTARHCITREAYFLVGPTAAAPERVIPVRSFEADLSRNDGFIRHGIDVAVGILAEPVTDVAPVAVGDFRESDVGRTFTLVGFGFRGRNLTGTRMMGTAPVTASTHAFHTNVGALAFGSFEAFVSRVEETNAPRRSSSTQSEEEYGKVLLDWYNSTTLVHEEVVVGRGIRAFEDQSVAPPTGQTPHTRSTDAQPCRGDSGGPLLSKHEGPWRVYGVASWGLDRGASRGECALQATVYASIGPRTRTILDYAMSDACGDETTDGRCEGTSAVRCSRMSEGKRRIVVTDCAAMGLRCVGGQARAMCTQGDQCSSESCTDGRCDSGQVAGAACQANEDCLSGACVQGRCAQYGYLTEGAPCTRGIQCETLTCTRGRCAAGRSRVSQRFCGGGEPCEAGYDCLENICVRTRRVECAPPEQEP